MEEVRVKCAYDEGDTLAVRSPIYSHTGPSRTSSAVILEIRSADGGMSAWLTADDARKVRDALNAALEEDEAKKNALKKETFLGEGDDKLHVSSDPDGVILRCSSKDGFFADLGLVDKIIAKLILIRDAQKERQGEK